MKKIFLLLIIYSVATVSTAQKNKQVFVSTDIDNFWIAYDKVISTKDSIQQYKFLNELYLTKEQKV